MADYKDREGASPNNQSAETYNNDAPSNDAQESNDPAQRDGRIIFTMHDTPPPMMISDGSVFIDTDEDFRNGASVGGGKQQHRRPPRGGKAKAYIHAIRVVLGNGET